MTNTQGLTSPNEDNRELTAEDRKHVLSSDCWCNPTVVSFAEVKHQGDTTTGWLTEREAWLTGNDSKPRELRVWQDSDGLRWDEQPDGSLKLRAESPTMNDNLVLTRQQVDERYGPLTEVTSTAKAGV